MSGEIYVVKFGPRVKKVQVNMEAHKSFRESLETAVRSVMSADSYLSKQSERDFFLCQYDEAAKADIEIDDFTSHLEVDQHRPIVLMLHDPATFVSTYRSGPARQAYLSGSCILSKQQRPIFIEIAAQIGLCCPDTSIWFLMGWRGYDNLKNVC